jgi:hypothetical protein
LAFNGLAVSQLQRFRIIIPTTTMRAARLPAPRRERAGHNSLATHPVAGISATVAFDMRGRGNARPRRSTWAGEVLGQSAAAGRRVACTSDSPPTGKRAHGPPQAQCRARRQPPQRRHVSCQTWPSARLTPTSALSGGRSLPERYPPAALVGSATPSLGCHPAPQKLIPSVGVGDRWQARTPCSPKRR